MDKNILDELSKIDINKIDYNDPEKIKSTIVSLFNIIEKLVAHNNKLLEENQKLKNEINNLKGEKGKPDIKANNKKNNSLKLSSLEKKNKKHKKGSKKNKIKIDREEMVKVDKSSLPVDAEFKGYKTKVVQNIQIKTDNVLYKMECYYSKSENKTYYGKLPDYLKGSEFGAELKAFVYSLYYECRVTENKIVEILATYNIKISEGSISNILIYENAEEFSKEKQNIFQTALEVSDYQQVDDTGMRVDGVNHYATIFCNEYYSTFFIRRYKNRDTIKKIIHGIDDEKEIDTKPLKPLIKKLIADDAPQFKEISEYLGLCWIHEARHYEKMIPTIPHNKELVEDTINQIWEYYKELKKYKDYPTESDKIRLDNEFDKIFFRITGYDDLDDRLKLTYNKKERLLLVLDFPEIPLHNNMSEAGVRGIVTKRKISGGVRTAAGKVAWENALSIYETCKKNSINFYSYILEIFKGNLYRLSLSEVIHERKINEKIKLDELENNKSLDEIA
jgi:hypothetical protein